MDSLADPIALSRSVEIPKQSCTPRDTLGQQVNVNLVRSGSDRIAKQRAHVEQIGQRSRLVGHQDATFPGSIPHHRQHDRIVKARRVVDRCRTMQGKDREQVAAPAFATPMQKAT